MMLEIQMCKIKKASNKVIEQSAKRLYEESIKRRLKKEEKMDYDNDTNRYIKKVKNNNYYFQSDSDNEKDDYNKLAFNLSPNNINGKINSKDIKKKKNVSVTEYNNKRFNLTNNFKKHNLNECSNEASELRNVPQPTSFSGNDILNSEFTDSQCQDKKSNIIKNIYSNSWIPYQGNKRVMIHNDASKIVDYFFTQNLNGI